MNKSKIGNWRVVSRNHQAQSGQYTSPPMTLRCLLATIPPLRIAIANVKTMGEKSKSILLVTVGSTLFPRLTDTVLSAPVLESLADQISVLRVQLGRAQFPPGLRRLIGDAGYENEESMKGRHGNMEVEIFRFTSDFEGLVASSDLVISHAGSLQS